MWLIEDRVFPNSEEARLRAALEELSIAFTVVSGSELRSRQIEFRSNDIARGSCWWISQLMLENQWDQTTWGARDDFSFSNYADRYGKHLLNSPFRMLSFHELGWHAINALTDCEAAFIRPDDGFKSFEGQVVTSADYRQWLENVQRLQIRGSLPLIIAKPKSIYAEWRCVFVDGQLVGSSMYRPTPSLNTPRTVIDFACAVHRSTGSPCRCYVMDIADTAEGFRIIEIGSVNCVAFYEADLVPIARAIAQL